MANDVERQVQALLGRSATPEEVAYFQKFMQDEGLTAYEIGQAIQSAPEFQNRLLDQQGQQFAQRLAASDQDILGKTAAAGNSQFAALGRPVTSAQGAMLAQAGQNLAAQRQSALAQFYGQGMQNVRNIAQAQGQGSLDRGYGLRDEKRQFGQQMQLAQYQNSIYDKYLNQANRLQRNQGFGAALGALAGAGIGASLGGPQGALAGAGAGSRFGQGFGGLF